MATIRAYIDMATNAADKFNLISRRLDELDRSLAKTRDLTVGDTAAMATFARLQLRADRFRDSLKGMNLSIDAGQAQATLLTLEATSDRLDRKLSRGGGVSGFFSGLLGRLPGPLSNPEVLAGAAGAALPVLPLIAQQAASLLVAGLGAGLAGVGVLGAAQAKRVQRDFTGRLPNAIGGSTGPNAPPVQALGLVPQAMAELRQAAQPFVGVLKQISQMGQSVLPAIMMTLASAFRAMAPAVRIVANAFTQAFAQPAVQTSILAVAHSFALLLKALAPQIPGDVKAIADGITNISRAVARNPKAFADFIEGFFRLGAAVLFAIGWLTQIADVIEQKVVPNMVKGFGQMGTIISKDFDTWRHDWAHIWDVLFSDLIGTQIRAAHDIEAEFNTWRHNTAVIFDGARHDIAAAWDLIWNNSVARVQRGISDVEHWFNGLPAGVKRALSGLGSMLLGIATGSMNELWNGFKSVGSSILSWLGNFVGSIVGDIKKLLGIGSPSSVFFDIGKNMMLGLENGIKAHAHSAASAATGAVGAMGGPTSASAAQAQLYARSRLGAYGWGPSQMAPLIALWNAESGWNRFARNPTSGAYGIPQALPPGKMGAAANPPMSSAAAQINWGLGYIKDVYGSPAAAEGHEQAFHWYGLGGIINEPVLGIGASSGSRYVFGENGPERVTPLGSPQAGSAGGPMVNVQNMTVRDPVDLDLIAQRLSFGITASSLQS